MKSYITSTLCVGLMAFAGLCSSSLEGANAKKWRFDSSSSSSSDSCPYVSPWASSAQQNWSSFSKNNEGWRFAKDSYIKFHNIKDLSLLYTFPTVDSAPVSDSPVIVDGIAYLADFNGYVYAFKMHSGETVWQTAVFPGGTDGFYRAPVVGKDLIYVGASGGGVFALDRRTGDIVWSEYIVDSDEIPSPFIFAPLTLIECENIILSFSTPSRLAAVSAGRVQARNASTGEFLWEYVTTGNLMPNQPNTGTAGGGIWVAPGVVNTETGTLFVTTGDSYRIAGQVVAPDTNSVLALNYRTGNPSGELLWYTTVSFGGYDASGPLLATIKNSHGKHQDIVIASSKAGDLYALDQKNGDIIWKIVLTNPGVSPESGVTQAPCTDGENVYINSVYETQAGVPQDNFSLNKSTAIVAVRLSDGQIQWRRDFVGSSLNAVTCSGDFVYFTMFYGSDDANPPVPSNLFPPSLTPLGGILRVLDKRTGEIVAQYVNNVAPNAEDNASACGVTLYKNYLAWGIGNIYAGTYGGVHVFKLN